MTTKHTPTPWFLSGPHNDGSAGIYTTANPSVDSSVAAFSDVGEANAAFIVRACNAHDELVAALENTLQFAKACQHMSEDKLMRQAIQHDIDKAEAALRKARGEA